MKLNRKHWLWLIIVLIGSVGGLLLWKIRAAFYPFILAVILAYCLYPAVTYFEAKGIKRLAAIFLVYLLTAAVGVLLIIYVFPLLVADLREFIKKLPLLAATGETVIDGWLMGYERLALPQIVREECDAALAAVQLELAAAVGNLAALCVTLLYHSLDILISPVLAFYLLADWPRIKLNLIQSIPVAQQQAVIEFGREINKVLIGVVRGQILVAVVVGAAVTVGLYFLKVPFAVLIGMVAGALDVIPYFGALLGAAPAVTLALLTSPALAMKVAALFFVIHQLEGTIIGPKILGEQIGLHPLTVIFSLFAGEELCGVTGMLLGVPVTALLKIFFLQAIDWLKIGLKS